MNIVQAPLKIVNYPHPSLRYPARPLTHIDEGIRYAVAAMRDLMYQHHGLGLAAPQVGLPYQLIVINPTGDPEQPEQEAVLINPAILDRKGTMEGEEGCLSFPGLFQKVRRARTIRAQAYNLESQLLEVEASELPSRLWQHEVDHLHGTLFIDKLGPVGQLAARAALEEFEYDYKRGQRKGEIPPEEAILAKLAELAQQA